MVRVFSDPDSCEAIDYADLPYSDRYNYCAGDALDLPVTVVGRPVWVFLSGGRNGAKKLFQRATVQAVLVEEDRVRVEYPSGATYKVRPALLEGILAADLYSCNDNDNDNDNDDDDDKSASSSSAASELLLPPPPRNHNNNHNRKHYVLLYRETDEYRRACVIHCGINETFCEIGCAEGITCEKIRQTGCPDHRQQVPPIGIDKSNSASMKRNDAIPRVSFC
jgi:hypothetical protein